MRNETSSARALLLIAALGSAAAIALRFYAVDPLYKTRREQRLDQDFLKSPGVDLLQLVTFEHSLGAADITWLAIVQELGKDAREKTDADWDRVERWTDIATDLDPIYFNPYHSVAIHLALYAKRVDASDRFLEKGWAAIPNEWQFPFVLAYNAYFIRGEPGIGADFMQEAARLPGAPRYVPALAGRMRYHAGDVAGAIDFLETIIPDLEGVARSDAEERLAILKSEPRMKKYDEACKRFRDANGRRPESGAELQQWAQIPDPPVDLMDHPIELDVDCIARTEMIKVREFEAAKRVGAEARGETMNPPPPSEPQD